MSRGPVANLEEHVPPDWWNRIFNSLYLKTDADVVNDPRITRNEVDLIIQALELSPRDRILDLCCGQGRHTLELARRGYTRLEGLDRSHYLIQKARDQARQMGAGAKFHEGDARQLPWGADSFDAVLILGNSFGYFETLQDDLRVLKEVRRVLKPWGQLLIDIADGQHLREHYQARSWEWISQQLFVCRERSLSLDGERLVSREVITHVDKGILVDQFYAERLYTRESLERLLAEASFTKVAFPETLVTTSQRAQDLGMMERRIIAISRVRKEWTPLRARQKNNDRHIAVVMGDPQRPDTLKPASVFDEDDFYTIDQLKGALQELEGYRFTYLTNHDTLVTDLMKLKGKIDYVFNICDEGYSNDPRNELYVPALLEVLGIPYTGAGPQCLAYCYDKSLVRGIAKEMDIPVADAWFIRPDASSVDLQFDFPVIVKPNFGDSSFGITARCVAYSAEELLNAVQEIREQFGYEKPILVEKFLTGKDLTVGLIGTAPSSYLVLPISEEDYSSLPPELPPICGYEAKWNPESPYWNIKSLPAELPDDTQKALMAWCVSLAERLECRDYTRFDWRLDENGMPHLLEANPNPGWCWDGHLAKMAAHGGYSYPDMLRLILKSAEERLGLNGAQDIPVEEEHAAVMTETVEEPILEIAS
ncbi:MAG: methyltransferase domain-containing protein [Candidatus Neomarinimicrobiota bacterium]